MDAVVAANWNALVPAALVASWTINDLEEWFTMGQWTRKHAARLRSLKLPLPWPEKGMTDQQTHLAITLVGVGVLAAAAAGVKSQGRSSFYRSSVLAFGLHGLTHLGQVALFRGYTPGSITAVLAVLPFWAWAEHCRKRNGADLYTLREVFGACAIIAGLVPIVGLAGRVVRR